ncbi:hypothetical protein P8452_33193 [Trifolium repens]|nr:hypothetical protein P8452_33193 [Trifolium repens]
MLDKYKMSSMSDFLEESSIREKMKRKRKNEDVSSTTLQILSLVPDLLELTLHQFIKPNSYPSPELLCFLFWNGIHETVYLVFCVFSSGALLVVSCSSCSSVRVVLSIVGSVVLLLWMGS